LKSYLFSVLLSLIVYIPYFPIFFSRFFRSAGGGTWVEPPVLSDLYTMVWRYLNAPVVTVAALFLLAAALIKFIAGVRKGTVTRQNLTVVIIIWFFVPYLLMFLVSFKIPMFLDRYTVFISIGFYLLIAASLTFLSPGTKQWMIMMSVFIIMMAITFHPRADNKRHLKETVNFISELRGSHTMVIICPQWLEYGFSYHYDQSIFRDYKHLRSLLNQHGIYPVNGLSTLDTNVIRQADQVLYLEEWASLTDPGETLFHYLNKEFRFDKTMMFYENFKVHRYIKQPIPLSGTGFSK